MISFRCVHSRRARGVVYPGRVRTRGLLAPVPHRSSSGLVDEISSVMNSRILIEGDVYKRQEYRERIKKENSQSTIPSLRQ